MLGEFFGRVTISKAVAVDRPFSVTSRVRPGSCSSVPDALTTYIPCAEDLHISPVRLCEAVAVEPAFVDYRTDKGFELGQRNTLPRFHTGKKGYRRKLAIA